MFLCCYKLTLTMKLDLCIPFSKTLILIPPQGLNVPFISMISNQTYNFKFFSYTCLFTFCNIIMKILCKRRLFTAGHYIL